MVPAEDLLSKAISATLQQGEPQLPNLHQRIEQIASRPLVRPLLPSPSRSNVRTKKLGGFGVCTFMGYHQFLIPSSNVIRGISVKGGFDKELHSLDPQTGNINVRVFLFL